MVRRMALKLIPLITYDETGAYSPEVKAMLYGC